MIVPQNTAPLMPATQNARPAKVPCTMPITSVPLSVARATDTNRSTMRLSSSDERGM